MTFFWHNAIMDAYFRYEGPEDGKVYFPARFCDNTHVIQHLEGEKMKKYFVLLLSLAFLFCVAAGSQAQETAAQANTLSADSRQFIQSLAKIVLNVDLPEDTAFQPVPWPEEAKEIRPDGALADRYCADVADPQGGEALRLVVSSLDGRILAVCLEAETEETAVFPGPDWLEGRRAAYADGIERVLEGLMEQFPSCALAQKREYIPLDDLLRDPERGVLHAWYTDLVFQRTESDSSFPASITLIWSPALERFTDVHFH